MSVLLGCGTDDIGHAPSPVWGDRSERRSAGYAVGEPIRRRVPHPVALLRALRRALLRTVLRGLIRSGWA
jgi:hypothetical protein